MSIAIIRTISISVHDIYSPADPNYTQRFQWNIIWVIDKRWDGEHGGVNFHEKSNIY